MEYSPEIILRFIPAGGFIYGRMIFVSGLLSRKDYLCGKIISVKNCFRKGFLRKRIFAKNFLRQSFLFIKGFSQYGTKVTAELIC